MKKIIALFAVLGLWATQQLDAQVAYAASSMVVVKVENFAKLDNTYDKLRGWAEKNASVRDFLNPVWDKISAFDIKAELTKALELEAGELEEYFSGPTVMAIGSDFEMAKKEGVMPVSLRVEGKDESHAREMLERMLGEKGVVDKEQLRENYWKTTIKEEDEEGKTEEMVMYVAVEGRRVIVANTQSFLDEALAAEKAAGSASAPFWKTAAAAEMAVWVNPGPFWKFLREEIALNEKQMEEEGESSPVTAEMFDKLGLMDVYGAGLTVKLEPFEVKTELTFDPETQGILKLLGCSRTGIAPMAVLPEHSVGFTVSRGDLACLWEEIKALTWKLVPAAKGMYEGWVEQVEKSYGVNVNDRFFGGLGDTQIVYEMEDERQGLTTVFMVGVEDAEGFELGLNAMLGFSSPQRSYFEKSMLGKTPVWRLKSQYQMADVPAVAYAVTQGWVIVTMGDPLEMERALEAVNKQEVGQIWKKPLLRDALKEVNLTSLSYRPLAIIVRELALAIAQKDDERAAINGEEPLFDMENIPSFTEVKGSLVSYTTLERGVMTGTFKIADE